MTDLRQHLFGLYDNVVKLYQKVEAAEAKLDPESRITSQHTDEQYILRLNTETGLEMIGFGKSTNWILTMDTRANAPGLAKFNNNRTIKVLEEARTILGRRLLSLDPPGQ